MARDLEIDQDCTECTYNDVKIVHASRPPGLPVGSLLVAEYVTVAAMYVVFNLSGVSGPDGSRSVTRQNLLGSSILVYSGSCRFKLLRQESLEVAQVWRDSRPRDVGKASPAGQVGQPLAKGQLRRARTHLPVCLLHNTVHSPVLEAERADPSSPRKLDLSCKACKKKICQ